VCVCVGAAVATRASRTARRSFLPVSRMPPGSRPCHAFAGIDLALSRIPRPPPLPHLSPHTPPRNSLRPPPRAINRARP